jgi:hypothetical protein
MKTKSHRPAMGRSATTAFIGACAAALGGAALLRKPDEHHHARKTHEDIDNTDDNIPLTKERLDEIEIECADQTPVECANDHKDLRHKATGLTTAILHGKREERDEKRYERTRG